MNASESLVSTHELVRQRASTKPEAIALIDPSGKTHTYKSLIERSDRFAGMLVERAIGCEARVLVSLEPGLDLIAALLGSLQAGAAFLPLDTGTPPPRIQEIAARAGAALVVCARPGLDLGPDLPVLSPERWDIHPPPAAASSAVAIHPQQLAYIIFTSGSTGVPKGVMMPHLGLDRLIAWQCSSTPGQLRTLAFAPIGFDVSLQEVLSTLASGSTLVQCDEAVRRDPGRLLDMLVEHAIERLFLTPTSLQRLAEAACERAIWPRALRYVIAAGEALVSTTAIQRLFEHLPDTRLDNHYGPTEAHLVTSHSLVGPSASWPDQVPIGVAVAGVSTTLASLGGGEPAEDGTAELLIGGIGVARGYSGDPVATALRFVPDSDATRPGAVAYRTGDLVRLESDGTLSFHGRADRQIKVRGFRVEPAEVEHQLCAIDAIVEAAVDLRTVADGVEVLAAYVVTKGAAPSAQAMAEQLSTRLPAYLVPTLFVPLPALPRTASGKIDRNALQATSLPDRPADDGNEAVIDVAVRQIWERVLGHADFDDDEDFFDVGGDSLLAAWVVAELSRLSRREITLAAFLDCGTVDALADLLSSAPLPSARPERGAELVTLRQGPPGRLLFLIHPLGGELLAYREFARALTTPVRVLGLRLFGNWHEAEFDFQQIAASHIAEIRAIEPHGPYRLAGWSFGGALAYEMARQLREAGEVVSFLGLIDANPELDPLSGSRNHDVKYLPAIDQALRDLACGEGNDALGNGENLVAELLGGAIPEAMPLAEISRYLATTRACLVAAQAYRPDAIEAAVELFQAGGKPPELKARLTDALKRLAKRGLLLHEIAADHFSMMRQPAVADLAEAFDGALRAALASEQELT